MQSIVIIIYEENDALNHRLSTNLRGQRVFIMDEKMMQKSLKQFFQIASQNQELQEKLKAAPNREAYISLVVELGKEKGYSFTSDQVVSELDAAAKEAAENGDLASQLLEEELDAVAGGVCLPTPPPTPPPGGPAPNSGGNTMQICCIVNVVDDIFD